MFHFTSILGSLMAVALVLVACGGDAGSNESLGPLPAGDAVLVAQNSARWEQDRLTLPAGKDLVIVVDNQDKGIAHNVHFKTAPGNPMTKLEKGRVHQTLHVRFDQPGSYPYVCDLHPTMKGVAVVG